jgi:ATP-dependent DNA ligase
MSADDLAEMLQVDRQKAEAFLKWAGGCCEAAVSLYFSLTDDQQPPIGDIRSLNVSGESQTRSNLESHNAAGVRLTPSKQPKSSAHKLIGQSSIASFFAKQTSANCLGSGRDTVGCKIASVSGQRSLRSSNDGSGALTVKVDLSISDEEDCQADDSNGSYSEHNAVTDNDLSNMVTDDGDKNNHALTGGSPTKAVVGAYPGDGTEVRQGDVARFSDAGPSGLLGLVVNTLDEEGIASNMERGTVISSRADGSLFTLPASADIHKNSDINYYKSTTDPAVCEEVPQYLLLSGAFDHLSATTKRLAKQDVLVTLFRRLLASAPASILPAVFLCSNITSSCFAEDTHTGVGGAIVSAAVREALSVSSKQLREAYRDSGDLGDAAYKFKSNQRTLITPKPLTISGVYSTIKGLAAEAGAGSEARKRSTIVRLLRACRESECKWVVRTLVRNIRTGCTLDSILSALAVAAQIHHSDSSDSGSSGNGSGSGSGSGSDSNDGAGTVGAGNKMNCSTTNITSSSSSSSSTSSSSGISSVSGANTSRSHRASQEQIKTTFSLCPSVEAIVEALVEGGPDRMAERCRPRLGVPISPMLAKPMTSVAEALEKIGCYSSLPSASSRAPSMMSGEQTERSTPSNNNNDEVGGTDDDDDDEEEEAGQNMRGGAMGDGESLLFGDEIEDDFKRSKQPQSIQTPTAAAGAAVGAAPGSKRRVSDVNGGAYAKNKSKRPKQQTAAASKGAAKKTAAQPLRATSGYTDTDGESSSKDKNALVMKDTDDDIVVGAMQRGGEGDSSDDGVKMRQPLLNSVTCEYKYDGQRAQIHIYKKTPPFGATTSAPTPPRQTSTSTSIAASLSPAVLGSGDALLGSTSFQVKIFSRNMEDTTSRYPDVCAAVLQATRAALEIKVPHETQAAAAAITRVSGGGGINHDNREGYSSALAERFLSVGVTEPLTSLILDAEIVAVEHVQGAELLGEDDVEVEDEGAADSKPVPAENSICAYRSSDADADADADAEANITPASASFNAGSDPSLRSNSDNVESTTSSSPAKHRTSSGTSSRTSSSPRSVLRMLPFQTLSTRARKDVTVASAAAAVQVCCFVFDVLTVNEDPAVMQLSLRQRRAVMQRLVSPVAGKCEFVPHMDLLTKREAEAETETETEAGTSAGSAAVSTTGHDLSPPAGEYLQAF